MFRFRTEGLARIGSDGFSNATTTDADRSVLEPRFVFGGRHCRQSFVLVCFGGSLHDDPAHDKVAVPQSELAAALTMALIVVIQRPINAAVIGDANKVSNECCLFLGPSELDGPFFEQSLQGEPTNRSLVCKEQSIADSWRNDGVKQEDV